MFIKNYTIIYLFKESFFAYKIYSKLAYDVLFIYYIFIIVFFENNTLNNITKRFFIMICYALTPFITNIQHNFYEIGAGISKGSHPRVL